MAEVSKLQRLIDQGFDLSTYKPFPSRWKVGCSSCQALVINGIACHETGCPNERKARDASLD